MILFIDVLINFEFESFQLSLVQLATATPNGKDAGLSDLRRNCPSVENSDFWLCMNRTLHGKCSE